MDEVMRQKPTEQIGPLTGAIRQDLYDKTPAVIVEHRLRHPAEEGKGIDVAVNPSLGNRRWTGAHKSGTAEATIQREEVRLLLHATNHHHRFTEVSLGMASSIGKWHKHPSAAPTVFMDVGLDRRIAALEAVFIAQPLENPLGSVPLLAIPAEVVQQPRVDEARKAIQLRPFDLRRPRITGLH